jgi:hypothetical protein
MRLRLLSVGLLGLMLAACGSDGPDPSYEPGVEWFHTTDPDSGIELACIVATLEGPDAVHCVVRPVMADPETVPVARPQPDNLVHIICCNDKTEMSYCGLRFGDGDQLVEGETFITSCVVCVEAEHPTHCYVDGTPCVS